MTAYCRYLEDLFPGSIRSELSHGKIIRRLDSSAPLFWIVMIKTIMKLPYTSFISILSAAGGVPPRRASWPMAQISDVTPGFGAWCH